MDRGKELFKLVYLLFLMGKGHQPMNGNEYLQQTMQGMHNMNEIEAVNNKDFLDTFITSMEGQDPAEMLNTFLSFICDFHDFFRDPDHQFNDEMNMDLAVNMYVCCILYQMGLQFPCQPDSCVPSMDVLCDMVQKQMPTLESDADAVLEQLNYSFLIYDNDEMSTNDNDIFKRDMAPRRNNTRSMIVKIMYVLLKENVIAEMITGSNSGKIYDSAAMYEQIDVAKALFKVIQNPFGNNSVVTLKVNKAPKAVMGSSSYYNVSIESAETCLHFEKEVEITEVAFHDGVIIQKKTIKIWPMKKGLSLKKLLEQQQRNRPV